MSRSEPSQEVLRATVRDLAPVEALPCDALKVGDHVGIHDQPSVVEGDIPGEGLTDESVGLQRHFQVDRRGTRVV
jgi:hypothetical protein